MKKYLAILLSVVLLLTSVLSVSMFTASAEGEATETLTDTVVMPTFVDEFGNEINMPYTSERIPTSVMHSGQGMELVKNNSALPFTTLFKFNVDGGENNTYLSVKGDEKGKGIIIYVEMPESEDGEPVVLSMHHEIYDGQSGEVGSRYSYGGANGYYLEQGAATWSNLGNTRYGPKLPSGFKGYVYVPFTGLNTGANDDPSTPESEFPVYVHQTDEGGNYLYTDNLTGEQTTKATDANGDPNTPVTKPNYQPSGTANCGIDEQDYYKGIIFQTGSGYMYNAANNMKATDTITVSAPIIVKGEVSDSTPPSATSIIANGKEHYYNGAPLDLGTAYTTFYETTVNTGKTYSSVTSTVVADASVSTPLTPYTYKISDYAGSGSTWSSYAAEFSGQSYTFAGEEADVANGGVMFYIKLTGAASPAFATQTVIAYTNTSGEAKTYYCANSNNRSGGIHYLAKGATAWVSPTQDTTNSDPTRYNRETDIIGDFEGYIYFPWSIYGSGVAQYLAGTHTNCNGEKGKITYSTLSMSSNATNAETGAYEDFYVSAPIYVTYANIDNTKVVFNNKIIDLATDVVYEAPVDYAAADEFYGDEALVNNGNESDILAVEFSSISGTESILAGPSNAYLHHYDKTNYQSSELVASNSAFKHPLLSMKTNKTEVITTTAASVVTERASAYSDAMSVANYDGYLIYIKNDSATESFSFGFQHKYSRSDKTASTYTFISAASLYFLKDGTNEWTTKGRSVKVSSCWAYVLKAGEGGYFYIPKSAIYSSETASLDGIGDIRIYIDGAVPQNFTFGAPMWVTNWTEANPGLVNINNAEVTQDIWTGDFKVPNDYDGDLAVNLLDLVRGKAKGADITDFRDSYIETYFNDAEYSVLSVAFSVASLAYSAEDAETVLSENPDRGYRSELFCFFDETPLTIAETPDYNVNIGGTDYSIDVSANTIRGANGVIDENNLDTDYNIDHKGMTPYGVGSGGAVHTVAVDAAANYAKANDLAYATEADLISAAVKMVSNYMLNDYRPYDPTDPADESGMSNIDVSELKRPVYDYEDGYAEMEGAANGSNYGYYKWAKTHTYDTEGNITEIKLLVAHGRRTIFATDSEEEWRKRWAHMFDRIYAIGSNASCSTTDNFGVTTYNNPVANNLFNAYLTFTNYAHKDELSEGILEALDFFFDFCRERGVKSCFRPAYNTYTENAYLNQNVEKYVEFRNHVASQCADEETMIAHIKQMAPVIAENKDVIHKISSGWIGFGGEMAAGYQYPPVSYKNVITAILDYHCIPNGLYFSSRSSTYYTNIINGVAADPNYNNGLGYGNLDIINGLSADSEWAEKYAEWCGFNNDAFFGEQNYDDWGSSGYYEETNPNYDNDTALAYIAPNDGEMYTNGSHVSGVYVDENGVYHWVGDGTAATDNKIPTPIEAIRELAHHRYTDFSQWHGYLDNVNTKGTTTVMELWQDFDAEWVFEGEVDSIANGAPFNARERAVEFSQPITAALLEANGILYDPAYFENNESVSAYEFIRDHLGYRLVAKSVTVDFDPRKSGDVKVGVTLNNYGFAAAFNMESSLAVFDSEGNLVQELAAGDPSKWYSLSPDYYSVLRSSSAQKDVLNHRITASFDELENGTYYVGLKVANSADSAARLANDVEMKEGYNILGSFRINKLSPT